MFQPNFISKAVHVINPVYSIPLVEDVEVIAVAAAKCVTALTANEGVVASVASEGIVAGIAIKKVVTPTTIECVTTIKTVKNVILVVIATQCIATPRACNSANLFVNVGGIYGGSVREKELLYLESVGWIRVIAVVKVISNGYSITVISNGNIQTFTRRIVAGEF